MASELETFAPSAAVRAHPVLGGLVEDFTAAMVTANDRLAFAQKAPVHWEAALHAAQTSVDSAASVVQICVSPRLC